MNWAELSESVAAMAVKAQALDSRACKLADVTPEKRAEEIAAIAKGYYDLDGVSEELTANAKRARVKKAKEGDAVEKPRRNKRGLPSTSVTVPPSLVDPSEA